MGAGSLIRQSARLALLLSPCALQAQDLLASTSPVETTAAENSSGESAAGAGQCDASGQSNESLPPTPVLFASTGVMFSLPPEQVEDVLAPCKPSVPLPPRPLAPDIFGLSAVPVQLKFASKEGEAWEKVRNASLQGKIGPWNELLDRPDLQAADNLLATVNSWVNWHVRYAADKNPNDWNEASITLLKGRGDCTDYAVAKMALLQQLGVIPENMFLIVLRDERRSLDHAVLAVRRNGTMYVLDNQTDLVLPAERIHDYRPMLSYNGPFAWVYGSRTSERTGATGRP